MIAPVKAVAHQDQSQCPGIFTSERFRRWLIRIAFSYTENFHLAEDLASETICVMFSKWSRGRISEGRGLPAYAVKTMRYLAMRRNGRSVRCRYSIHSEVYGNCFEPMDKKAAVPGEGIEKPESKGQVGEKLEAVRQSCSETQFRRIMAYFSGLQVKEIAAMEGCVVHSVSESIDSGLMNICRRHRVAVIPHGRRKRVA